jgi:acetyl-CoA carboxylase biotin carboxyl carrier protein
MEKEKNVSSTWLKRVEDLIIVMEGSSIGELELAEGETEIIIRRSPHKILTVVQGSAEELTTLATNYGATDRASKVDKSIPIAAPLTGVYYAAASPTTPPFVNIGDTIHVGHVVALVEAMKVFNEVTAEVSGRVVALVATNGSVVQKGDILLRVEPV